MEEIERMTEALEQPVSIAFDSHEEARRFRYSCYRYRDSLRLVGNNAFNDLKFKLNRNILTIVAKPKGRVF